MLSMRGMISAQSQDIPWRFAPGGNNRYDPVTNPTGVISFATAENNLMHGELHQYVEKNTGIPKFAYTYSFSTMGGPRFPQAMAAHINEHFRPFVPTKAGDIITGSALTAIHEVLGYSLGDPGDGILVSRPVYGRFELDFGNTDGLKMVYADMDGIDPFAPEAVPKYEEAFERSKRKGTKAKAVLIVNPHNPLGRTFPPETLRALMAFAERKKIHLISDEVYALSTYDTDSGVPGFTSVLSINSTDLIDDNRLHVLYGMSKDFAAAGLRLGTLITRNAELRKAVGANMRFHHPSGPSIAIGTALLQDREFVSKFITLSRQRLKQNRDYTMAVLDSAGIKYERCNAGFFIFIDLSPWLAPGNLSTKNEVTEPEFALAQKLLDAGVGLHPREEHAQTKGRFRLVFSQQREVLAEGLRRLTTALEKIRADGSAPLAGNLGNGVLQNSKLLNGVHKVDGFLEANGLKGVDDAPMLNAVSGVMGAKELHGAHDAQK